MNVYSRKPLEAYRSTNEPPLTWGVQVVGHARGIADVYTDVEFAEHFYPAERLDTLIAAVEAVVAAHEVVDYRRRIGECDRDDALNLLVAAFRAFREQVTA